jgi:hypothetical protein
MTESQPPETRQMPPEPPAPDAGQPDQTPPEPPAPDAGTPGQTPPEPQPSKAHQSTPSGERHSKDAIEKISFLVGEKGLWGLDRDDVQTITYETGYVFGRILKRLGIRTGPAVLKYTTVKKPAAPAADTEETPIPIHHPDPATPPPQQAPKADKPKP